MTVEWRIEESETHYAWLQLEDPEGWYSAGVKFDGCVHLHRYHNIPKHLRGKSGAEHMELEDYLHICDIDEEIERLQGLLEPFVRLALAVPSDAVPAIRAEMVQEATKAA